MVLDAELDVFHFTHLSVQKYLKGYVDFTAINIHTLTAEKCVDIYIAEPGLGQISKSTVKQNNVLNP